MLFIAAALASAADPVASLKSVQLPFDSERGYLPALLTALHIPIESQIAVFSKTSIQSLRIEPSNPRLLYFNDAVSVGWVRGGFIEIAAQDPQRGIQFYTLQQRPDERVVHRDDCQNCHKSSTTLLRSVVPTPDGIPSTESSQPWGGWFVTGAALPARHIGNTVFAHAEPHSLLPTTNSDVVALEVFAHQMLMMNLLAHPDHINELVDHLLFLDKTPLPSRIEGSSGFTEIFEAAGPFDHCGRSLRQFDLKRRLMRYPCSYMIYTAAFNSLPSDTKDAIYRRMWTILSGAETTPLSLADRKAVIEILRDTKPDLPAYFVSW
jgi:hypothetical protein